MDPSLSSKSPGVRRRPNARETRFGKQQSSDLPWVKVIPYDYQAKFEVSGELGRVVEDVINISVEGVFVAVAIGYAFQEDRTEPLTLSGEQTTKLGDLTLDRFPPDALIDAIRISPRFRAVAITESQNGQVQLNRDLDFSVA